MIDKIIKNPIIGYVSVRYLTYVVQFVNSILIAIYLGPVYLGIWGFINLILQYLLQINFGVAHSTKIIASLKKHHENYISLVVGNAILILIILSILIASVFLFNHFFNWGIGSKYSFENFYFFVLIIGVLGYFIALFSGIFRVFGKYFEIIFSQSAFPFGMLITLIFSPKETLLFNLLWVYVLTSFISICLFVFRFPIKIKFNFSKRIWKVVQKKGWFMFLYNSSFFLIIISTRSFVSQYYSVRDFGYFTFAFSLANALLLLLTAISFLITPKLLNNFSKYGKERSRELIKKLRDIYIVTSHLIMYCGIFLFPFFIKFLPQYSGTFQIFGFIALTVILQTHTFGYSVFLIGKEREKRIGYLSLTILLLNIIICYLLAAIWEVAFYKVMLATLFSYSVYAFVIGIMGRNLLNIKFKFIATIKDVFPLTIITPYLLSFFFLIYNIKPVYFFIPLVLFLILNIRKFKTILKYTRLIILKPKSIEF